MLSALQFSLKIVIMKIYMGSSKKTAQKVDARSALYLIFTEIFGIEESDVLEEPGVEMSNHSDYSGAWVAIGKDIEENGKKVANLLIHFGFDPDGDEGWVFDDIHVFKTPYETKMNHDRAEKLV